jgi:hypothetical protein
VLPVVEIETEPVIAPGMTMATSEVPLSETGTAATPPILRLVILPKLDPVMVIRVPTGPEAGLNVVIV